MSASTMETFEVRILDREYTLQCTPEERGILQRAVDQVDERMRQVRDTGRLGGVDRIAVMVALQFALDAQRLQQLPDAAGAALEARLARIEQALGAAVPPQEQLF